MHRNFVVCPHCTDKGLPGRVWNLAEQAPGISLSDGESFHLIFFNGPDAIPAPSGGVQAGRLAAQFSYVDDALGTRVHRVAVILTRAGETVEGVKAQLEDAATTLAELLERGRALSSEYSYDGEQLWEIIE
jgi:hypothetical protein